MRDFDNGLPPAGTTTNAKITDLVLHTQEENHQSDNCNIEKVTFHADVYTEAEVECINGILLDKAAYVEAENPNGIRSVCFEKSPAGLNYGTFL